METAPRPTPATATEPATPRRVPDPSKAEPPRPLLHGRLAVFRRPLRRPGGA